MPASSRLNPVHLIRAALESGKRSIRRSRILWPWLLSIKAGRDERAYHKRRERYARTEVRVRTPLARRLPPVKVGEVHTFAIVAAHSWHESLLPELNVLGSVERFDMSPLTRFWLANGLGAEFEKLRAQANNDLLQRFAEAHARQPVTWIFSYAGSSEILPETLQMIRERYGVPSVRMGLDDKQSWESGRRGEQNKDVVKAYDLWWTSARVTVDWANAEGGRGIYLPEGCDPSQFHPTGAPYDLGVSFVGACYGPRSIMVDHLRRHGVQVQVFGPDWGKYVRSVWGRDLVEVFRRSQINLGSGAVMHSERITNVKTRDFEVPCTGGGVYLTTFNADLASHFEIGREILCWHSYDEMLELVRHYLPRADECREIARRARVRCLQEHRWSHRYIRLLQELGLMDDTAKPPPLDTHYKSLEMAR